MTKGSSSVLLEQQKHRTQPLSLLMPWRKVSAKPHINFGKNQPRSQNTVYFGKLIMFCHRGKDIDCEGSKHTYRNILQDKIWAVLQLMTMTSSSA